MSPAATPEPLNHQVAVVVRARLITALLDTATLILMVRLVGGKDEFGVLQIFLVGYELARYVATFGFPDSVYFFFAKLHDSQRRAFAIRTFQILTAGGALVALGMLAASLSVHVWLPGWSPSAQTTVSEGLPWLALVAAIELPTWAIYPLLVASDQGRIAGRFEVVTSSLAMIALAAAAHAPAIS